MTLNATRHEFTVNIRHIILRAYIHSAQKIQKLTVRE